VIRAAERYFTAVSSVAELLALFGSLTEPLTVTVFVNVVLRVRGTTVTLALLTAPAESGPRLHVTVLALS